MLFIKSFFRILIRHKAFTFINLFGLTFALAFILLIGTYLFQERSFDRTFPDVDRLYMILDSSTTDGVVDYRIRTLLKDGIPEIEEAGIYYTVSLHINYKEQVFKVDKIASVDNDFFNMFNLHFIKGNADKPFVGLDEAILTVSEAKKIFGEEDPMGKQVLFNHLTPLLIVGIVQDLPKNSSIKGDLFVNAANPKMHFSMSCRDLRAGENPEDKCQMSFHVFVRLAKNARIPQIESKAKSLFPKDFRFPAAIRLFPFQDYHLTQKIHCWDMDQGNPTLLKVLAGIVFIIALLAVFNYINLTTAGYKLRLKETGVKKGLGAQRKSIVGEYIMESLIMCMGAAYLSTLVARIFLPVFNDFLNVQLSISFFTDPEKYLLFFLVSIFFGLLAGIYPALYLSLISPRDVLSSGVFVNSSGKPVRNILNIFQFTIAIALITIILFMQKQIRYAKNLDLGFQTEHLLRLDLEMQPNARINLLKDKLLALPGIISMSATTNVPGDIQNWMDNHAAIGIDTNFYATFGIDVIDGRRLLPGDRDKSCLINETAWKKMENKDYHSTKINGCLVVGVVKDFHVSSMHSKIEPLGLFSYEWMEPDNLTIRFQAGQINNLMDSIRKAWKEICPDYPFHYDFYDEWFNSMYKNDENLGKLISLFAILAIVISCMGIFGLALFTTEQRSKEIGIRKVNGASSSSILILLSKDFTKWILLSFILSVPLSWYAMNLWLNNFAYKTSLSWWVYAIAGITALLVAVITVSIESWKAASRNPVEILRYE